MLGRMFGGPIPTAQDGGGSFFIDRDGKLFRYILNFLRNDKLTLPENFAELVQLREEVDFYQIEPMLKALTEYETTRDRLRERAEEGRPWNCRGDGVKWVTWGEMVRPLYSAQVLVFAKFLFSS